MKFLTALVERLINNYDVNPSQVYVTGASKGRLMTSTMLIEAPDLFAAGVAFIANLPQQSVRLKEPALPTPLLVTNVTKDPLMKWDGG